MRAIRLTGLVIAATACVVMGQGDLFPPGPPGPTMKTLAQVEPRIPITNVPLDIDAPGSYYFTTNLVSSSYGLRIRADRVVVDMEGFSLSGSGTGVTFGIEIYGSLTSPRRYVTVKNGTIEEFNLGVYGGYVEGCSLEDLVVQSNQTQGIWIHGRGNRVVNCGVAYNNDDGIRISPGGEESSANIIRQCMVCGNGTNVAAAGILLEGTAGGSCSANRVVDCLVVGNSGPGIKLNGYAGRCDGNLVRGCSLVDNGGTAIVLNYAVGNRIEANHITATTTDVTVGAISSLAGTNNFIFANTAAGCPAGMSLSSNDVYGPVVTDAGELSPTGIEAHAWANFVR